MGIQILRSLFTSTYPPTNIETNSQDVFPGSIIMIEGGHDGKESRWKVIIEGKVSIAKQGRYHRDRSDLAPEPSECLQQIAK